MIEEFRELLNTFNELGVKYLIVGGFAVMKYSEPRFTKDLDIWIEATRENATRVFKALRAFGAPLEGLTEADFAEPGFYQMGRPPSRIDLLMTIDGVDFDSAWENRETSQFAGIAANFIGRDELILNKRATGRHQDLADIEKLEIGKR